MLRASIGFFIVGLIAFVLGANNVAGLSMEIGKVILVVFVILALLSFLFTLFAGKKTKI